MKRTLRGRQTHACTHTHTHTEREREREETYSHLQLLQEK